jgi:hypothetical protein
MTTNKTRKTAIPTDPQTTEPKKVDPLKAWKQKHRADNEKLSILEIDWPGSKTLARNLYQYAYALNLDRDAVDDAIGQSLSTAVRAYHDAVKSELKDFDRLEIFVRALLHEATQRLEAQHPPKRDLRLLLLPPELKAARPKDNGREH